jgi:catechol 2,3-dioxygenase-like lactoylglutathione lyase family enzyme
MPYRFESLAPMLQAADLNATVTWYTSVLGFKCAAQEEGWARLERDEVALMFITDQEFGSPQVTGVQYIYVDDAMALWNDIKNRVTAERGPEQTDYGMLEFTIKDPNGYLLSFGQSTEGQGQR